MICNRCGNELPSDTPVCRSCGPVTLDPGFAPLTPLPAIPLAAPAISTPPLRAVAAPAVSAPETPAPEAATPPPPRQSKAQRRRAAMAAHTGGARTEPPSTYGFEAPLAELSRPRPITLLARLNLVVGAAELLVGWAMLTFRVVSEGTGPWDIARGYVFVASGLLMMIAALGLFLLRPLGWYAQIAILAGGLIWGSWSNIVGIAVAVYLLRPGVKLLLSGREATSLQPRECALVRKDAPSPVLVPVAVALQGLIAAVHLLPILSGIDLTR